MSRDNNIKLGKIYQPDYLGMTVQVVPLVENVVETNEEEPEICVV